MPRTAEVAGAGLSGLLLATRLAQLGWRVRLHERNAELRMFGAGIWIWESGLRALEVVGAYDRAVEKARTIAEWRIADPHGRVLMSRRTTPHDRLLLPPRADLYEALIAQAVHFGVDIKTSSTVVDMTADGCLQLADGTTHEADLVVAADGAYSRLRESISATSWMDFGHEAGIRMLIDRKDGDPEDTIIEYWHGRRRLLYNPCTDGQDYIFLSAPVSDERASRMPVDRDLWRTAFPEAAPLVERFAEASRWDRLVNVRCRRWHHGRAAVIGDAAHAMPPNLGQAANTAFINAMALAMILENERDVTAALGRWEKECRALTNHVQWWSYLYGFALAKVPERADGVRARLLRSVSRTPLFQNGLNKGARTIPAGARATVA
ncbi:monooxygenase [Mycobacterium saskatchewanense]|uniref:FAD-binding monooxygenase n=1 Tax=Mycobacterium saskatchewanense TaxID=220927 RepID=A0AAJ3NKK4_9MYCO|nr:NAD(P)/FAD-dependent oxidoreductase [Mycobacterium saskatchewanense]ORW64183.1 FAD-binding monooxygenase [Mycobacterium saskatchewanense]BBX62111.1 monooxygenase [Mycobacterium saskatchewanense]